MKSQLCICDKLDSSDLPCFACRFVEYKAIKRELEEALVWGYAFREALIEISCILGMPGAPDLAHDVPRAVRYLYEKKGVK